VPCPLLRQAARRAGSAAQRRRRSSAWKRSGRAATTHSTKLTGLALAYDQTIGTILVDNISVATKLGSQTWTCAADNGSDAGAGDAFTAEETAFLAQPFSIDELTYVDDLVASATADEWAAIQDSEPTA
jgi:hypothetical protein